MNVTEKDPMDIIVEYAERVYSALLSLYPYFVSGAVRSCDLWLPAIR
jgi:hypothetical protein